MSRREHLPLTPTFIDGLLLVVNAIPDLQLVIDCANCGCDKFAVVGMNHDFHSTLITWDRRQRACFSDLRANDLVLGTEDRLAETAREAVRDNASSMLLLMASSTVQLVGSDLETVAEDLEEELGIPVGVVSPKTFDGDVLDGYGEGLDRVARRLELPEPRPRPGSVALVGHRYDRGEEDQRGNLRELRRLFDALGVELCAAFPDGRPLHAVAADLSHAERLIAMPYGRVAARRLGRRLGCDVVAVETPVGLAGTASWLVDLGRALDREAAAREIVERELTEHVPKLEWVVRTTFMGRSAAVVFDPLTSGVVVPALEELGLEVSLVALQTRRASAETSFLETRGLDRPAPDLIHDPTFPELEDRFHALHDAGRLDVIVGSGRAREAAKALPVPYLELGYPSYVRHALFDAPWIGFRGAMWLADALMNLIRESEYRRASI